MRRWGAGVLWLIALPVLAQGPAPAAPSRANPTATHTLSGSLQLSSGGKPLRPIEGLSAIVYFRPEAPVPLTPPATPFEIVTERKQFNPRSLAIPVGATVRFPNRDPILHNAFSTAEGNAFDVGLYGQGPGESVTFQRPGVVRVFCNVHHSMVAHILVLDTPFSTRPNDRGRFELSALPAGAGELFVWHERAPLWRKRLVLPHGEAIDVALDLSGRRVPPHLNKFGKPYRRSDGGSY